MKEKWLAVIEIIDAARIVPRIFMTGYGYLVFNTHEWVTKLPDPTTQQTSYAGIIYGAAAVLTGWYLSTGRKWEK